MRTNERRLAILASLKRDGELSVDSLVKLLHASEATVRRDLLALEESGEIVRTYGGARLAPSSSLVARTFAAKRELMSDEKELIALAAAGMVEPGMTVAIDSGTTCWRLALHLKDKAPLTVFTYALPVVEELGDVPGMEIHCVGGRFRLENLDFVGFGTASAFGKVRSDLAFISGDAVVSGRGIFSLDEDGASIGAAMADSSERVVVLADSSKFSASARYRIAGMDDVSCLIADGGVPLEARNAMSKEVCEFILV